MKYRYSLLSLFSLLYPMSSVQAQCGVGEVEVTIEVTTDDFGYETYWQLVPGGNACGTGIIFEGGNPTMGCNSGGLQDQDPSGYGNNQVIVEGPWCLTEGALYDIVSVDDWGDGQAAFEVFVDGVSSAQFQEDGPINVFTFAAQGPVARDMGVMALTIPLYARVDQFITVVGTVKSFGSDPVASFDISYSVDGGLPVVYPVTGVTLNAGDTYDFSHPTPWVPALTGTPLLTVTVSNINGQNDLNNFNDEMSSQLVISEAIPDLISAYLAEEPLITIVASSDQDILVPRDLDFHPESARNELWVLNKDVAGTGGSTVTFYHPDELDMTFEWRRDPNAWHFMSLPTGIAMADNNCFATCPGIYDANQNGGDSFTGPSLWSADTAIYADVIYGPLGSHLDMLHVNPNSQGIAHDLWNRFWVVDGFNGDVVMNDFRGDHGPGNDYHGNAIIRRYAEFTITKDPNDHIVSHDVMDKRNGWLYVVDHGGQRVLRLNTLTGTVSGPGDFGPFESYVEYSMVSGYDWNVVVDAGLVEPAGIEIIGDHLLVSDHANGDIVIYDISTGTGTELGRIHTGSAGLMGIVVGPDGRIWGVNATNHQLLVVDPQEPTGIASHQTTTMSCFPSPASDLLSVDLTSGASQGTNYVIRDLSGRMVDQGRISGRIATISVTGMSTGAYLLELYAPGVSQTLKFNVAR